MGDIMLREESEPQYHSTHGVAHGAEQAGRLRLLQWSGKNNLNAKH